MMDIFSIICRGGKSIIWFRQFNWQRRGGGRPACARKHEHYGHPSWSCSTKHYEYVCVPCFPPTPCMGTAPRRSQDSPRSWWASASYWSKYCGHTQIPGLFLVEFKSATLYFVAGWLKHPLTAYWKERPVPRTHTLHLYHCRWTVKWVRLHRTLNNTKTWRVLYPTPLAKESKCRVLAELNGGILPIWRRRRTLYLVSHSLPGTWFCIPSLLYKWDAFLLFASIMEHASAHATPKPASSWHLGVYDWGATLRKEIVIIQARRFHWARKGWNK